MKAGGGDGRREKGSRGYVSPHILVRLYDRLHQRLSNLQHKTKRR